MIKELTKKINEKKLTKEEAISLLNKVVAHPQVSNAIEKSLKKVSGGRIPNDFKEKVLSGGRIPVRITRTITITETVEVA